MSEAPVTSMHNGSPKVEAASCRFPAPLPAPPARSVKASGGTPHLLFGKVAPLILLSALLAAPAWAIAEDKAPPPPPSRTFDDVKDELNAMVRQESESVKKSRELVAGISLLGVRETKVRNQLLRADPELQALSKPVSDTESDQERQSREKILQRRLREKSATLASMMDEKQALMDEHGKLQARIIDLRAQKDALFEEVRPRKTVSRPK